ATLGCCRCAFCGGRRYRDSFPTRRSSDLVEIAIGVEVGAMARGLRVGVRIAVGIRLRVAVGIATRVRLRVAVGVRVGVRLGVGQDRKSTRLNSSHVKISYAVVCLEKETQA